MDTHRFSRTELLIGREKLERLNRARVTVCGLGAVGSFAVEALARSGIGHLCLVDFDDVRIHNANRQLFALDSTLGKDKSEAAAGRVADINPECEVDARHVFVDRHTCWSVLEPRPDVLIDAMDSLDPKIQLIVAAVESGIPVLSSMGAATRVDPLAVCVGDVFHTFGCPLARLVRKRLRRRGVREGVRCVYSTEPRIKPSPQAEEEALAREADIEECARGRPRQPLGSMCIVPGLFGLLLAHEAIRQLLDPAPTPP